MDALEKNKQEIFGILKQFVTEIIGEDYAEEIEIVGDSSFTKDLEMDSIEIVAFAEKVKDKYGDTVDFTAWLSNMEFEQLMNLNMNDIVNFIADGSTSDK